MTGTIRYHITLSRSKIQFDLWRLTDEEYRRLRQNSLPIKEDLMFLWQLALQEHQDPNLLTLPKAFTTLEKLFGKTSDWFDNWKGSFSFPLLLAVKKPQENFFYLFRIYDHRGNLSFPLYRILENGVDGYKTDIYREPFELEFSREEINQFISYFYGYLTGYSEEISQLQLDPFLKRIDSNHIFYGYRDGEFFEEQIDSEDDYQQAIEVFEQNYHSIKEERQSREIQSLLQTIISEYK